MPRLACLARVARLTKRETGWTGCIGTRLEMNVGEDGSVGHGFLPRDSLGIYSR